jgi:formylglycine-generating enzyme required for sulfatase activity
MVLIPAGEFIMGDANGYLDERPLARVRIPRAFYMARCEIPNTLYTLFDPTHDSGVASIFNKDHSHRGQPLNRERQPVCRISWQRASAFCYWLSQRTGRQFTLPTEAQWEWAARGGTATPLYYGTCDTDFSRLANLADLRVNDLCIGDSPKWIPAMITANDGAAVSTDVGHYTANPWGLFDMVGNVSEWTLSAYRTYPYNTDDGRDNPATPGRRVARGGSWFDRPIRARSAVRFGYEPWQVVHDVGFRVICDLDGKKVAASER